jgi:tetratricopeptide (TPR) repeat protein
MWERNYDECEKTIREALRLEPDNLVAMGQLSYLLKQRGRDEESKALRVQIESKLPKANPIDQFFVMMDGFAKDTGTTPAATEARLKELEKQYSNDFQYYYIGGLFYMKANNFPMAIQYFEKALKLAPWMAQVHNQLGYLYTYVCKYDKAIQHLEAYARLLPDRANPHDSLGETYYMTGRYEDAIREFQSALSISPSFIEASYHLMDAYSASGQYEKALQQALRVYESSDSPEWKSRALVAIAGIQLLKGNLDLAREKAQAAVDLNQSFYLPLLRLGLVQVAQGDFTAVQATLEKWQKQFPLPANGKKNPKSEDLKMRYDYLVARMNEAMGNFQAAIQGFQRVSDSIPILHRSIDVRRDLAESYFAAGQPDHAKEILGQILAVNPNHVASLLLAAKIAASQSKNAAARDYLARCQAVLKKADPRTPITRDVQQLLQQVK